MSRYRLVNAAATMVTLLALGAAAMAAEILERPQSILELQPGMTKILPVDDSQPVQAIAIGNPNIADASAINLYAIAITGKGAGLTNVILFDGRGKKISDTKIQVVGADAYRGDHYVRERHEVRVLSMWGGPSSNREEKPIDRRYLCAHNCGTIRVDEPVSLNPPGNTSAAVGTITSKTITTAPTPQGQQGPEAPTTQGRY
jgi:hypothetical protein